MHVGSAVLKPAVDTRLVDARVGLVGSAEEHGEGAGVDVLEASVLGGQVLEGRCWVLGEWRRGGEAEEGGCLASF